MNVSSTTALARELEPFKASFLSTDVPRFSWLKYQFLDLLTTIEVTRECMNSLRNKKCLYHHNL